MTRLLAPILADLEDEPRGLHVVYPVLPRACPALVLALGLALGGCGNGAERTPEESGGAGASGEVAVLRGLTPGDRACYAEIEDARGQRRREEAAFELCERAELVDRRVRLTRERTPVLARSCQGDPECSRRDTVDLILSAEALP